MNLFFIFFLLCTASQSCNALIVESSSISDVLTYAQECDPETTLILFDIDNTVATQATECGGDAWFVHNANLLVAKGFSRDQAHEQLLPLYLTLQHLIDLHPVEHITPHIIKMLQNNFMVMALTLRGGSICNRTIQQLRAMHIDFSLHAPSCQEHTLDMPKQANFRHGILFTNGDRKDKALLAFLKLCNYYPKTIIFIDDKLSHLEVVQAAVEPLNINFIGIRYSACDKRVADYCQMTSEKEVQERMLHYQNLMRHLAALG